MIITHKIRIDLSTARAEERIDVAQDDKYSRDVEISLYSSGVAWEIPNGVSALFRYEKPDGKGGTYDKLPDESSAFVISGNKITARLAPQVCNVPGITMASVSLMMGTSEINTFPFAISVRKTPGVNSISDDYINAGGLLPASGWNPGLVLRTDENGNVVAEDNFRRIYADVDINLLDDATVDLSEKYGDTIKKLLADVLQARSLQLWVSDTTNGVGTASFLLDDFFTPPSEDGDLIVIAGLMPNPLSGSGSKFELQITEKPGAIPSVILRYTANIGGSGSGLTPEQAAQIEANTDAIAALPIAVNADTGYTEIEKLPRATNVDNVLDGDVLTVTSTLQDGRTVPGTMTFDANGYPESYTEEGVACKFSFTGFEKTIKTVELPVVELSTTFAIGASYTAEENAKLKAAWESETPVVIKCQATIGSQSYKSTCAVWDTAVTEGDATIYAFIYGIGSDMLQIYSVDSGETWGCNIQ